MKCHSDNLSDSKYCKECATPLPSPEEIQVSNSETLETPARELITWTIFTGRYEVIEKLGNSNLAHPNETAISLRKAI